MKRCAGATGVSEEGRVHTEGAESTELEGEIKSFTGSASSGLATSSVGSASAEQMPFCPTEVGLTGGALPLSSGYPAD